MPICLLWGSHSVTPSRSFLLIITNIKCRGDTDMQRHTSLLGKPQEQEGRCSDRNMKQGKIIVLTKVCSECHRNKGEMHRFENQGRYQEFKQLPKVNSVPGRKIPSIHGSQLSTILLPQKIYIWQYLDTFLIVTMERGVDLLLSSSG